MQVSLTHGSGNRAVPIWFIHGHKHSGNYILGVFIKRIRLSHSSAPCLEVSQDRQVARHKVTISYVLTCSETLCGAIFRRWQVASITIQLRQFEHGVRHNAIKLHPGSRLACFLQICNGLRFISRPRRQFAKENQHLCLMTQLFLCPRLCECVLKYILCLVCSPHPGQRLCFPLIAHEGEPRILISFSKSDGSLKKLECLNVPVGFFEPSSQKLQKTDLATSVAICHCREQRSTQQPRCPSRISFHESY